MCAPCQSGCTFNHLWSLWHFQKSLASGSPNQTDEFKICWANVLTHLPHLSFSSSYIKVNVNYPLLFSISRSSIIQNVIEKHYLNPVLTEIQALSFPQGRHNWIPPEATAVKHRARGKSRLSVVVFCILCVSIFTFLFQGLQSDPTAEVSQLIDSRTIPWECLEAVRKCLSILHLQGGTAKGITNIGKLCHFINWHRYLLDTPVYEN